MRKFLKSALAAAIILLGAGCGRESRSADGDAAVAVTVNALGTPVATIVITVDGPDIAQPLVFNLPIQDHVAVGTLRIPPGELRTVSAVAFASDGAITAEGAVTLPVVERGWNPPVSIPMVSRAGHVPITIQIGAVSIAVSPASAVLEVGETLQLTADITSASGDEISAEPEWATTDPTVLEVTSAGLVTALRAGQADIVATYAGVAGVSRIEVSGIAPWSGVKQLGTTLSDYPSAVAVDAQGHTYVAGDTGGSFTGYTNAGLSDAFVAELDTSGNVISVKQFGTAGSEYVRRVEVDSQGNTYVFGTTDGAFPGFTNAGRDDAFIAKIDATGTVSVNQFGTAQYESGIAVDPQGNTYLSGTTTTDAAFLAKLNVAGEIVGWTELGTTTMGCDLLIDAQGNAYLWGDNDPFNISIPAPFVAKVYVNGEVRSMQLPVNVEYAWAEGATLDDVGNLYVVGSRETWPGGMISDVFVAKVDGNLDLGWMSEPFVTLTEAGTFTYASSVAVDALGGIFVSGQIHVDATTPSGDAEAFVAKLDPNGNLTWPLKVFGTAFDDPYARPHERAVGIVVDAQGNTYASGTTDGAFPSFTQAGGGDAFVAKFDALGVLQ